MSVLLVYIKKNFITYVIIINHGYDILLVDCKTFHILTEVQNYIIEKRLVFEKRKLSFHIFQF